MSRGPVRDPDALRKGTGHRRRPATELAPVEYTGAIPVSAVGSIPTPKQLPRTKAVRDLWRNLCAEVARTDLRPGDVPLLEALVVAKVRHTSAGMLIKKHGFFVETPYGLQKNPALAEERQCAILYDRLAQRLGLSPESRVRLNLMAIAGVSMLGSLRTMLDESVEAEMGDVMAAEMAETGDGSEVVDGEVVEDGETDGNSA